MPTGSASPIQADEHARVNRPGIQCHLTTAVSPSGSLASMRTSHLLSLLGSLRESQRNLDCRCCTADTSDRMALERTQAATIAPLRAVTVPALITIRASSCPRASAASRFDMSSTKSKVIVD